MPSSRDADLSPAPQDSSVPPALGGSTTTGSDMALGSHAVTAGDKRHDSLNFKRSKKQLQEHMKSTSAGLYFREENRDV